MEPIQLNEPQGREVLVRLVASGICHSDEHVVTGDLPALLPIICGHEGAGVVEAVGPDTTFVAVGDHVVFGFVPSCGSCPSCARPHAHREAGRRLHLRIRQPPQGHPGLAELYATGKLDLDGMITRTYSLDDINEGSDDMRSGTNIRGVLKYA